MYAKYVEFLTSFLKIKLRHIKLVFWKIYRYLEEAERREDFMTFFFIQVKSGHLRSFLQCRSKLARYVLILSIGFQISKCDISNSESFHILWDWINL